MDIEEKLKGIVDAQGNSLYEHILNTIGKLVQDHPKNAYEVFEEFSLHVKQTGYKYNDTKNYSGSCRIWDNYPELAEYFDTISQYFGFVVPKTDEDNADPPESTPIGYVPDIIKEERMFRQIGVSFGEYQTFIIFNALKKFCLAKNATQVKFWGKIFGTTKDYFIVEAVVEGGEEQEIQEPHEPKGTGANAKQYFVTTDLIEGLWVELPLIMPRYIINARKVKHTFTGDLNKQVNPTPNVFGTEREYLRAQIARISHATDLTHKGLFKVKTEDDGGDPNGQEIEQIEDEEELKPLRGAQLAQIDNWVHMSTSLLKEGRCLHQEYQGEDDDEKELYAKKVVAMDPFEPRLKPISADKYLDLDTCWVLRKHGDFSYMQHQYKPNPEHDTFISIRSLVWPGFYLIGKDEFFTSLYIGDGQKYSTSSYFHIFPYMIQSEPHEVPEENEPNPPGCEDEPDEDEEQQGNDEDANNNDQDNGDDE